MLYTWNSSQPVEKIPRKKCQVEIEEEEERAVGGEKKRKKMNFFWPPLDSNLETIFFINLCCLVGTRKVEIFFASSTRDLSVT